MAVGADHGGFPLKGVLIEVLRGEGAEILDFGTDSPAACDYPDLALPVARAVGEGRADWGLLICGTGIGMSMVANKVPGVRAALCHDPYSARMAREHNDANVLCLGARVIGPGLAEEVLRAFIRARFAGGRHARRVDKIRAWEAGGRAGGQRGD
ncbi:MAG: ribose 5-phosphate isomerase B [Bacillota bacterium]